MNNWHPADHVFIMKQIHALNLGTDKTIFVEDYNYNSTEYARFFSVRERGNTLYIKEEPPLNYAVPICDVIVFHARWFYYKK